MTAIVLKGRPVSANHMWRASVTRDGKPFTYMPAAAKETREFWRLMATSQWRKAGMRLPAKGDVSVDIKFFFENRLRRDLDNYLKVVLDSLTGIAYDDDTQIVRIGAEKACDPEDPRIEIFIK